MIVEKWRKDKIPLNPEKQKMLLEGRNKVPFTLEYKTYTEKHYKCVE